MQREQTAGSQMRSIKQQINKLMILFAVSMTAVIIMFSLMLLSISRQYEGALLCANTAAGFNKEFKDALDLEMYNHVIQPRNEHSVEELPMEEIDRAETVIQRLESITSLPDNRWRARSMLGMCENLRTYMLEIAKTASYDQRMELLDRNIVGETGLTRLVEQYMHDFIDDEVEELARLRTRISTQSMVLILVVVIAMSVLLFLTLLYSMKVSRRITEPIIALTKRADQFGEKEEMTPAGTSDIIELKILDENFSRMAERISWLMKKQIENERSLHRAELELLQAQINPHFLYNTLDSIVILAENHREEDVVNMVTSLSTFFRNSLSHGEDIIPLHAELAQASSYLEIQQIRYSDILTYSISVPETLSDCLVPKLILQPLIENALYHGIKNRRGLGTITITGETADGKILLKVRDNGAGMSHERLKALQNGDFQDNHSGLGIKNVHQRIRLYCGAPYGLSFESRLGEGTVVTILLPIEGPDHMM